MRVGVKDLSLHQFELVRNMGNNMKKMTAQWPVIGRSHYYTLFSRFFLFFLSAICMAVSLHPFSFLIGRLEFEKASLPRWVFFGNGGFISPPLCLCVVLFPFPLFPLFAGS